MGENVSMWRLRGVNNSTLMTKDGNDEMKTGRYWLLTSGRLSVLRSFTLSVRTVKAN